MSWEGEAPAEPGRLVHSRLTRPFAVVSEGAVDIVDIVDSMDLVESGFGCATSFYDRSIGTSAQRKRAYATPKPNIWGAARRPPSNIRS